jgi:hypothetical protein
MVTQAAERTTFCRVFVRFQQGHTDRNGTVKIRLRQKLSFAVFDIISPLALIYSQ